VLVAMQGMDGFFDDVVHTVVKVATLPITAPLSISKDLIVQGVGVAKGVLGTAKDLAVALKPPPPPPPPVLDAFGLGGSGGGASLSATSSIGSTSMLPFVIGGVALLGLVTVAVLVRKKKKGRR
jgi:LPXTG-motif cell wall-anchored protein